MRVARLKRATSSSSPYHLLSDFKGKNPSRHSTIALSRQIAAFILLHLLRFSDGQEETPPVWVLTAEVGENHTSNSFQLSSAPAQPPATTSFSGDCSDSSFPSGKLLPISLSLSLSLSAVEVLTQPMWLFHGSNRFFSDHLPTTLRRGYIRESPRDLHSTLPVSCFLLFLAVKVYMHVFGLLFTSPANSGYHRPPLPWRQVVVVVNINP